VGLLEPGGLTSWSVLTGQRREAAEDREAARADRASAAVDRAITARRLWATLIVAVLGLGVGVAGVWISLSRPPAPPVVAQPPVVTVVPAPPASPALPPGEASPAPQEPTAPAQPPTTP
jgi:hypothetical protein